jgi:hypothetical protein
VLAEMWGEWESLVWLVWGRDSWDSLSGVQFAGWANGTVAQPTDQQFCFLVCVTGIITQVQRQDVDPSCCGHGDLLWT